MEYKTNRSNAPKSGKNTFLGLLRDFLPGIIIVGVCLIIFKVILLHGYVPTGSMIPTVLPKDGIIANRLSYLSKPVERYDIVVFPAPDDKKTLLVKRVIGLPGETVSIKAGDTRVFINGQPIDEPYLAEEPVYSDDASYKVPEGKYFVMGDNRNFSSDARYWNNKYLDKKDIIGKTILRYSLWGENGFYFKIVPDGIEGY